MKQDGSGENRAVFTASFLAASLGFFINLGLFIYLRGARLAPLGLQLVGMRAVRPVADLTASFAAHGSQVAYIMSIDTLFVICYLVLFSGLYVIACVNSRILAQLGLGAALLTAIVDTGENILTIFIAYNAERALGYDISGLLIFFFMLTSFKWVGAASALVLFACALPRSNWLERTVVLIGLIFAIVAVLGLSWPGLGLVKAVLLWMAMPFFALLFWQYRRSDPPNPIPRS